MTRDEQTAGGLDLIKRYAGYITAVIGFVTGVVNFIKLLRGDQTLTPVVLLAAGTALLWASFIYLWLSRVTYVQTSVQRGKERLWKYRYSQWLRRLALCGIAAVPILALAGYGVWRHHKRVPTNKIIILIADLESVDREGYGVTQQIIEQLRSAVAAYPEIEVQALDRVITVKEGGDVARALGSERQAGIVLWGWCQKSQATVHFELLMRHPSALSLIRDKETLVASGAGLDQSFTVQTQVSADMAYLILLTVGILRYEAADYDGAIERWQKALSMSAAPQQMIDPAQLHYLLGEAYFYKGDYPPAIRYYSQALDINSQLTEALIDRGAAYFLSGDRQRAAADSEEAIKSLNEYLAQHPDNGQAYYVRGIAYYHKGDMDRAITDYTAAIEREPNFAFAFDNRAGAYAEKGDYNRALADLNESLRLAPDSATAYYSRGNLHFHFQQYDLAVADYTQAIKLDPTYYLAYDNRGMTYDRLGDKERALGDYSSAIKLKPGFADPYDQRGLFYASAGALDFAINDFTKAIALKPEEASTFLHRGMAYTQRGDIDQAIKDFEQAIKLKPDYSKAFNYRGVAYGMRGAYQLAIADFNKAIELEPSSYGAFYNRSHAYELIGNSAKSEADRLEAERLKQQSK